jgi:hypothetical protein
MGMEAWQSLVHVCRRWRNVVFRSPRRLNLRLFCTSKTPTKDALDVWPALPLVVEGSMTLSSTDNIIAALEMSNRVCQVYLWGLAGCQLEKVFVAMQVPFPDLTDLQLFSDCETLPVIPIPDSFLGGSAPQLRIFTLDGIPFPGFPNLLLSANHLVDLVLIIVFFTRVGGARSLVIKISNSTKMLYLAEYSLKSLRLKTICETKFAGIQL